MEYILNSLDGGILKTELNRPQKRNALALDMYTEFAELLNTAQTKTRDSGSAGVCSGGQLLRGK
jgi:enoyl-CoA hydratase/carnithine racemase